jgi:hypothetical protein
MTTIRAITTRTSNLEGRRIWQLKSPKFTLVVVIAGDRTTQFPLDAQNE